MNSSIDSLNMWGVRFLDVAVPMLWQSCLLIAVVFALDLLCRRKIRAAVRYSLWFVVFVKLLVPPTLALPTGAAWWLRGRPAPPPPVQKRVLTVQYTDEVSDYVPPVMETAVYTPPPPKLSREGWILISAMAMSGLLAAWLVLRWVHVARCVRRTTPADAEISEMLEQACRQANLRGGVMLRVTSEAMSPAVCGLFRPVILLPQSLIQKLTPNQLRAVLLHELIHLRRRDVWVNCAQTLLQIVYWWNPLLWLANARVRRVREEAVDDAVMCALQAEAEIYAPTLLEVAKLAFSRPLASLGLVGILESRSALRHRIERLLNFATPRRAGVSVVSVICLAAFTALAVPMGEPPARPAKATLVSDSETLDAGSEKLIPFHAKVNPEVFRRNVMARAGETMHTTNDDFTDILVSAMDEYGVDCTGDRAITFNQVTGEITALNTSEADGVMDEVVRELNLPGGERILNPPHGLKETLIEAQFYELRPEDAAKFELRAKSSHRGGDMTPWAGLSSDDLAETRARLTELGIKPMMSPRIQTFHGVMASLFMGDGTNDVRLECVPYIHGGSVDLSVLARTTGTYAPEGKSWPDVGGHTNCAIFARVSIPDGEGVALTAKPEGAKKQLLVLLKAKIIDSAAKTSATRARTSSGLKKAPNAATLITDGKSLYELGKIDEAAAKFQKVLEMDPNNPAAQYYLTRIMQIKTDKNIPKMARNVPGPDGPPIDKATEQARQKIFQKLNEITFDRISYSDVSLDAVVRDLKARTKERDPDGKGMGFAISLSLAPGWTNFTTLRNLDLPPDKDWTSIKVNVAEMKNASLLDVLEAVTKSAQYPLTYSVLRDGVVFSLATPGATPALAISAKLQELYQKLSEIKFDKVSYANLTLGEVARNLAQESHRRDPAGEGINILLNKSRPAVSGNFDPTTGQPIASPQPTFDLAMVKINVDQENITLVDLLQLIAKNADHPIKYSFLDYGVEFTLYDTNAAPELHTRTFRVDTQKFFEKYPVGASGEATNATAFQKAFLKFFNDAGVNIKPPKSLFFGDRQGTLTVHGTDEDLEHIESALTKGEFLSAAPPAIRETAILHTRTFAVRDMDALIEKLKSLGGMANDTGPSAPDAEMQPALLTFLKKVGVGDLQAPKNAFLNYQKSTLIARTTDEQLRRIQALVDSNFRLEFTPPPGAGLLTRTFKLDVNTFFLALQKKGVLPTETNGVVSTPTAPSGQRFVQAVLTDSQESAFRENVQNSLLPYFRAHGVNLQTPKSLFYNDSKSTLTVRATDKELDTVERLIGILNSGVDPDADSADADQSAPFMSFLRTFKVNANAFHVALQNPAAFFGKPNGAAPEDRKYVINLNSTNELQVKVIDFFAVIGVDLLPPKSVYYDEPHGTLSVRATAQDLEVIATTLNRVNATFAQNSRTSTAAALSTRNFKVDPNAFLQGLSKAGVFTNRAPYTDSPELQRAVAEFFRREGVNLNAPKTVSYQRKEGILSVQTTADDFDAIEKIIAPMTKPLPEVTIKGRFVEVDTQFLKMLSTNGVAVPVHGAQNWLLTEKQFKPILKALANRSHANLLNEGQVTTLSGHQANFQVVDVTTVVFSATNNTPPYDTKLEPFGTTLDISARVAADGHTIQLMANPSQTEFLGYRDVKNQKLLKNFDGTKTTALPVSRSRQTKMDTTVSDGDTLILGDLGDLWVTENPDGTKEFKPFDNKNNKRLVVFVTPTIVDRAGNRVNKSEANASLNQKSAGYDWYASNWQPNN